MPIAIMFYGASLSVIHKLLNGVSFFLKTAGPIPIKFGMGVPWPMGLQVCSYELNALPPWGPCGKGLCGRVFVTKNSQFEKSF